MITERRVQQEGMFAKQILCLEHLLQTEDEGRVNFSVIASFEGSRKTPQVMMSNTLSQPFQKHIHNRLSLRLIFEPAIGSEW